MRIVVQRVKKSSVSVDGKIIGSRELVVKIVEDKIDGWGSRWEYLGCYERE